MISAYHLPPLDDDDYFVQWETGRLGVNISEDKESELPYVSKITDAQSPLAAAMEVGDFLLCVNELRAEENSFNNFLRLLTTKQKPVLLRFRRGTPATRNRIIANHDAKYPPRSSSLQRKSSKEDLSSRTSSSLRPILTSDATISTSSSRLSSQLSPSVVASSSFARTRSGHQADISLSPVPSPPPPMLPSEHGRSTSIPESRVMPPSSSQQRSPAPPAGIIALPTTSSTPPPPHLLASSSSSSSSSISDDAAAFIFSWVDGPLGVFFGEDDATQLPVVTRTLSHASPLITANVQVGDTLVSANGLLSRDHPFAEFFAALQKMTKPIQLVFAPSTAPLADDVSMLSTPDDAITGDHVTTSHEPDQGGHHRPNPPPPRSPASRGIDVGAKGGPLKDSDKKPTAATTTISPLGPNHVIPQTASPSTTKAPVMASRGPLPEVPPAAAPPMVLDERPYTTDDDDDNDDVGKATSLLHGHPSNTKQHDEDEEDEDDSSVITDVDLDLESADDDDDDVAEDAVMPTLEFIKGAPSPKHQGERGDAGSQPPTHSTDGTPLLVRPTIIPTTSSSGGVPPTATSSNNNERTGGGRRSRSGGKSKRNNYTAGPRLPRVNELEEQTIALLEPNSVNMKLTVRGRLKSQRVSKADTPDSAMYLVKWKENRSIGVQLRECRLAKGVYPMVVLVCRDPCCDALRHVHIGDLLVEINGRDTAMMSVKKTVAFVKTCTKTALLKFKRGPGISVSRVSA
ncbi:hypothetical protein DYB31_011166 [Aphanomyces astaci]|uniref:PDZ domain-containing protein n=1 Tax=Aphanomyces astaci TaxID=112090 RepID=A0A397FNP3_APHAT|nr:hypothetical protein DYB31_011166 [Aphanomyces astaci]